MKNVVIIGAGVMGLGTALALSQHEGHSITILDREHPGAGSSSLSAGMAVRARVDEIDTQIARRAYEILAELERDSGLTIRRIGYLTPARTESELEAFGQIVDMHREAGWDSTTVLSRGRIADVIPEYSVPEDVQGALWDPDAMFIDGAELCSVLTDVVKGRGVEVVNRAEVVQFREGRSGCRYELVTSNGDTFSADIVVNAAGPWGGEVGKVLGAPLKIANERHEAFIFKHRGLDRVLPMFLDFIPGRSQREGLYFRGEGPDRMLAGLHSSDLQEPDEGLNPSDVPQRMTEQQFEEVFELIFEAFPDVEIGFDRAYAGIYPHHSSNKFVLGAHPLNQDIYVGAGLGGRGLGPGVALGEILAETIVFGGPQTIPAATYYAPPGEI